MVFRCTSTPWSELHRCFVVPQQNGVQHHGVHSIGVSLYLNTMEYNDVPKCNGTKLSQPIYSGHSFDYSLNRHEITVYYDVQPRRFSTYGEFFFRDSVFICLLLPENVISCEKCLSKCGKRAKFGYIINFSMKK